MNSTFDLSSLSPDSLYKFLNTLKLCYHQSIFRVTSDIVNMKGFAEPKLFHELIHYRKRLSRIHTALIRLSYRPDLKPQTKPHNSQVNA